MPAVVRSANHAKRVKAAMITPATVRKVAIAVHVAAVTVAVVAAVGIVVSVVHAVTLNTKG
jgi:hypothetical protein